MRKYSDGKITGGKISGGKIFECMNALLMIFICIITLYPFINTAAISLDNGIDAVRGGIYLWPRVFSLKSYKVVFSDGNILDAAFISVLKTLVGIAATVICTGIFAFGLSKKHLVGRKFYLLACLFTLFFYGGIIPNTWYTGIYTLLTISLSIYCRD